MPAEFEMNVVLTADVHGNMDFYQNPLRATKFSGGYNKGGNKRVSCSNIELPL